MRTTIAVVAAAALVVSPLPFAEASTRTVARGNRVRITGAESFAIPGVATVRRDRMEGAFETRASDTLTARDADGRLLTLPLPDTVIHGTLASADETTLSILRPDGKGPIVIPRAAIGRLDVHRPGTKSATGTGIVLGFLGGLVVGTVYGFVGHPPFEHAYEASVAHEALAYGVLFSLPGMVMGGVIGSGRKDRWDEVPVGTRIRLSLGSTGGGAGARISVTW